MIILSFCILQEPRQLLYFLLILNVHCIYVESKQLTNKQIPQRIHTSNSVVPIMTAKGISHTHTGLAGYVLTVDVCPPSSFLYLEALSANQIKTAMLF